MESTSPIQNPSSAPPSLPSSLIQPSLAGPRRFISKKVLIYILSTIGVLVIAAGAYGYFYYFQSPEMVIQRMMSRIVNVKSIEYSGRVEMNMTTPDISPGTNSLSLTFNGATDNHDLENPKGFLVVNITTGRSIKGEVPEASLGRFEFRIINKILYLELSKIESGLFFLDLSFLENQWIEINIGDIQKQFEQFIPEESKKEFEELQKKYKLTAEEISKINEIVKKSKVLKITEKLSSEKIEGINTYHFKFIINKEELKRLVLEITEVVEDKSLSQEQISGLDKALDKIEEFLGGEIWIGKKDLLPYKIVFNISAEENEETKTTGRITITLFFKNFNKLIQVEAPDSTKKLEEIMMEILGGLYGGFPLGPGKLVP